MPKFPRSLIASSFLMSLFFLLISCGKPLQSPKSGRADSGGASLGSGASGTAVFVPGFFWGQAQALDRPDFNSPERTTPASTWIHNGDLWVSRAALQVRGSRTTTHGFTPTPAYLGWSTEAGGVRITNAFYVSEQQTWGGVLVSATRRSLAVPSDDQTHWFIPFTGMLPPDPQSWDSNDLYRIRIELECSDQITRQVTVEFRLAPPIPEISRGSLGIAGLSASLESIRVGSNFLLMTDEIRNPSSQPLKLWVGPRTQAMFQAKVQHASFRSLGTVSNGEVQVAQTNDLFRVNAPWVYDRVNVSGSASRNESFLLPQSTGNGTSEILKFIPILLGANEQITLRWGGSPQFSNLCQLPAPIPRDFVEYREHAVVCHMRDADCADRTITYGAHRVEEWSLVGSQFKNQDHPPLIVTAADFDEDRVLEFLSLKKPSLRATILAGGPAYGVTPSNGNLMYSSGDTAIDDSLPLAPCQGLY